MPKVAHEFKSLPKTYTGLCGELMPRPIHTAGDHDEAMEMVEALAGHRLNREQEDYLEALSMFLEAYDRQTVDPPNASPLDTLKHLMEQSGMNAYELGKLLGDASLGSKVLSGKRELSKAHIRTLCAHFQVTAAAFL
jgi:HTH-type transcriptional regulator/antitoxin HigA